MMSIRSKVERLEQQTGTTGRWCECARQQFRNASGELVLETVGPVNPEIAAMGHPRPGDSCPDCGKPARLYRLALAKETAEMLFGKKEDGR